MKIKTKTKAKWKYIILHPSHTQSSTWDHFKTYTLHPVPQRDFSKVTAYFWSNSTKWPSAPNFNGLYRPRRDSLCNINLCLLKPRAGKALHLLTFWKKDSLRSVFSISQTPSIHEDVSESSSAFFWTLELKPRNISSPFAEDAECVFIACNGPSPAAQSSGTWWLGGAQCLFPVHFQLQWNARISLTLMWGVPKCFLPGISYSQTTQSKWKCLNKDSCSTTRKAI